MFYVGLDVSVARTAVCIMDAAGQVVLERSVASTPETITATMKAFGGNVERIGLEAGINSAWIARGLVDAHVAKRLPVLDGDRRELQAPPVAHPRRAVHGDRDDHPGQQALHGEAHHVSRSKAL